VEGFVEANTTYHEILPPLSMKHKCEYCGALLWAAERWKRKTPCCVNGKKDSITDPIWTDMYENQVERGVYKDNACTKQEFVADMKWFEKTFKDPSFADISRQYVVRLKRLPICIHRYNSLFAFTSVGAKEIHLPPGPPQYKIQGQLMHNIGSLEPLRGKPRSFAQIYVLDSDKQTELRMGMSQAEKFNNDQQIVIKRFQQIMTRHNEFARS
jgi:hypothetical protein